MQEKHLIKNNTKASKAPYNKEFKDEPIPQELLDQLLEVARHTAINMYAE